MTDLEFIEKYQTQLKGNLMSYIQKKFPEIITFIHQRFSDLRGDEKIGEIYFRIINNIETLPKCKVYSKSLKFNL